MGRKEVAKLSRAKILEIAKLLFMKEGYENTTIAQLAQGAGVSEPTIYALFKSKLGVLRAIMDECFPESDHASLVESGKIEKSPQKRLAIAAKIARRIYDAETSQITLLQGAHVLSPELKLLEQEREERRYERLAATMSAMYSEKLIDENLTRSKALDIFWALTGRDLYRQLVIERKWLPDLYEEWLAETLSRLLLKNI